VQDALTERDYDRHLMALLSRKTKTDATEFAKSFYDRHVFGSDVGGFDVGQAFAQTFAEVTQRQIAEAEPSFAAVSLSKLTEELCALRLEMIGAAWTHESSVEAALVVSESTKAYLSSLERPDLWEAMTAYNGVVAESVTHGFSPESRTGRAWLVAIQNERMKFYNKWREGRDGEAVARVANRIASEDSWKSGVMQAKLAVQVTRRLDIEGSDPIWERLAAVAYGFYQGAKEELDDIRLTP
jgi:hypothetical protein